MAYYKILWGSRFCRDCGGKATKEWPLCVCKNTAPQQHCRPLGLDQRHFCEHCGGKDPGSLICPHCEQYPLERPGNLSPWLGASLRLPPLIAFVAIPVLLVLFVGISHLQHFEDAQRGHKTLLYGLAFLVLVVAPLRLLAEWWKRRDARVSRDAFRARHANEDPDRRMRM